MTGWNESYHMTIRPGSWRVWEGDVPLMEESAKAKDILYAIFIPIHSMPYEHKMCIVFIKQNFHNNGLIFVLH